MVLSKKEKEDLESVQDYLKQVVNGTKENINMLKKASTILELHMAVLDELVKQIAGLAKIAEKLEEKTLEIEDFKDTLVIH